ncbi:unnamed protein product [Arctogadus glacialis]
MHHSIFRDDSKPEVKRCTTCCTLFHCPLCPTFKPTVNTKLQCHLESHIKHSITFKDKKICRYNLSCRDGGHYHCPLCGKTIIRKSVMDLHLKSCTNTQDSPSTSAAYIQPKPHHSQDSHHADCIMLIENLDLGR